MKLSIALASAVILSILFTSNDLYSQKEYKLLWVEVDQYNNQGLPQSALDKVNEIYRMAGEDGETVQLIRALLYRIKLRSDFQEGFLEASIAELRSEIDDAREPAKQVLHSIRAELLWRYYTANRGKLLERTYVTESGEDISTWDMRKFVEEIISHYEMSLQNPGLLQKTLLEDYNFILILKENSKDYRPTLYDFLAHRALDYYMNDEKSIVRPAEQFEVDDPVYFARAEDFAGLDIQGWDSLSFAGRTLNLFQGLLAFHLKDKDPTALIDADLKRLGYIYSSYAGDDKDDEYKEALKGIIESHGDHPASADASYELARHFVNLGQQYDAFQQKHYQWHLKNALLIIKKTNEDFPESRGAENCRTLLPVIEAKELSVELNYANPPGAKTLGFLRYRNVKEVNFRIIRMNAIRDQDLRQQYRSDELIRKYLEMEPVESWSIAVPDVLDHQAHSAEFPIPGLPLGYYVLLASTGKDFAGSDIITHVHFWSTNLSFISKNHSEDQMDVYVGERVSGEPVNGALLEVFTRKYDYSARKYLMTKTDELVTGADGFAILRHSGSKAESLNIRFSSQADTFMTENYFYLRNARPEPKPQLKTYFFTDRSVYRPGQTVYFKGIMVEGTGNDVSIRKDETTTVGLYDVNGKMISEIELSTGEFGSFQGSFTLPESALTGQFRLSNQKGNAYFLVEEYKRPTFSIRVDPLKGSYRLNEAVTVDGRMMAYSGNPVDNASVSYRVVRKTWFPRWYWPVPDGREVEITNGLTSSGPDGSFSFIFKAIPDQQADKRYRPVFYYTIYINATDITGETQSTEKMVAVGYKSTLINIDIPEIISKRQMPSFSISTTNLNGGKIGSRLELEVFRLRAPENILRNRPWPQPDTFLLSQREFNNQFPGDIYGDEDVRMNWERQESILKLNISTPMDSVVSLGETAKWDDGAYLMVITTTDRYGEEIREEKFFTLYDEKKKVMPYPMTDFFIYDRNSAIPGETVRIHLGSSYPDVRMLFELSNDKEVFRQEWVILDNEILEFAIPVVEEHRGGVTAEFTWIRENRSYQKVLLIDVPYANKKLQVSFSTFRSELMPGESESWEIRIDNPEGTAANAEMLASMYDASLNRFRSHNWSFDLFRFSNYGNTWLTSNAFSPARSSILSRIPPSAWKPPKEQEYDQLNWFGYEFFRYGGPMLYRNLAERDILKSAAPGMGLAQGESEVSYDEELPDTGTPGAVEPPSVKEEEMADIPVRRNFRETAFFYPELKTDEEGAIIISFTVPESLTEWKFMGLVHDSELRSAYIEKSVLTRKLLMVVPNYPRFVRFGDTLSFSAKVVSLDTAAREGTATLEFFNALNGQEMEEFPGLATSPVVFTVKSGESALVSWDIIIPDNIGALMVRIKAKAGNFSDGEEKIIPVLPDRMMVTESLPLPVRGPGTSGFRFGKLIDAGNSPTLEPYLLTLEFTSNPAWYAVRALPYLMEPKYKSADAIFNQFYANTISAFIATSDPAIEAVFEAWKRKGEESFLSQLEKNEELKNIVLSETPWVMEAAGESEGMKRMALLFDKNRMEYESNQALKKLLEMQGPGGGWYWFSGMRENRFITQRIVTGIGKMQSMGVLNLKGEPRLRNTVSRALNFLEQELREDFRELRDKDSGHLGSIQINYLYARSFFKDMNLIDGGSSEAYDYYREQARKNWLDKGKYEQGMIALALFRDGDRETAIKIVQSLKEHALVDEEMGMYWREPDGYYWNQAPVERQALMIEVFDEIAGDAAAVEDMKIWLLKQKQTQAWKTNRATADAVYALLMKGASLLSDEELVEVTMGYEMIDPLDIADAGTEAGTGYFKTNWQGSEINPEMGNITVTKNTAGIAWGAAYFQYFEDLDRIEAAETPLSLEKKLFIEKDTGEGPVLVEVNGNQPVKAGDKVISRLEIRVDRDMEFVHLKDMRAASFEPVNVLSGYQFAGGLGYYESPGDVSTNFFMDYLRKGTYVIEYPVFATQEGTFLNGISTIQCLYAPEFSAHSEGIRVKVEK